MKTPKRPITVNLPKPLWEQLKQKNYNGEIPSITWLITQLLEKHFSDTTESEKSEGRDEYAVRR